MHLAHFRPKYLDREVVRDDHGRDLIEYALMAGFVAIAAGAIIPGVSNSISKTFSAVGPHCLDTKTAFS
jgi:Flp pilus assembly pilin Flp